LQDAIPEGKAEFIFHRCGYKVRKESTEQPAARIAGTQDGIRHFAL
jgi:hypothetical protein